MNRQEYYRMPNTEDLAHIRALAAEHNADLTGWCSRRRRYEAFRRVAVAVCILAIAAFNLETAYANVTPARCKAVTLAGDINKTETLNAIGAALHEQ